MRRERILLILGIWVAVLPYLGFPYSWKNVLFSISGLILIYYSYVFYKEFKIKEHREKKRNRVRPQDTFEERIDVITEETPEEDMPVYRREQEVVYRRSISDLNLNE